RLPGGGRVRRRHLAPRLRLGARAVADRHRLLPAHLPSHGGTQSPHGPGGDRRTGARPMTNGPLPRWVAAVSLGDGRWAVAQLPASRTGARCSSSPRGVSWVIASVPGHSLRSSSGATSLKPNVA